MLREAIIVEGRYDKIKLSGLVASPIIETGGFRVFKDKEKQALIRRIAARRGILVMTDVDSAGFVIRNFLRGIIPAEEMKHAYIPTVAGKERRKAEASKEGVLGVEGIDRDSLIAAIRTSGAHIIDSHCEEQRLPFLRELSADACVTQTEGSLRQSQSSIDGGSETPSVNQITKLDFYDYGLTGSENAAKNREAILSDLGLPKYLTVNAMLAAVNCLFTKEEFEAYLSKTM